MSNADLVEAVCAASMHLREARRVHFASYGILMPHVFMGDVLRRIGFCLGAGRMHAVAAHGAELRGILAFSEEPLVSSDFKRNSNSSIVDAEYTKVINGHLVKVLSWYDNEWGYSCRVRDLIKFIAGKGL